LYYFGARWYDPELGRWLSPEPLGLDGPNLYQFVWNNPVQYFDSNGFYADDVHYDMTYRLAKEVGFSPLESHQLASYDQGVDDNTPAHTLIGVFSNWELHFDTRENARKRLCDAIKRSDWAAFGKALHTFQDTYSHAGYSWPLGHAFDNLIGFSPDRYQPVYYSRDRKMTEETRRYLNLFLNKTRNNVLN